MNLSPERSVLLERIVRVGLVGVRFIDPVGGDCIRQLIVTAHLGEHEYPLWANSSGVFVLHAGLAGVRDFEVSKIDLVLDPDFWAGFPAGTQQRLTILDPLRRFLPVRCDVRIPTLGRVDDITLFSTPWRSVPEAMAVVRADLYDTLADAPAAHALVEILHEGRVLGRGLADERGQVAVIASYPPPVSVLAHSPPASLSPPRAPIEQCWTVEARIAYAPWLLSTPAGEAPELSEVLGQLLEPSTSFTETLTLGQELILRTPPSSRLFVTAAGSPP